MLSQRCRLMISYGLFIDIWKVMEWGNVKEGLRLGWLLYMLFHMLIQLFGERLSEKVPMLILRGVVGGFEFTVLQRNLKELAWKTMKMCLRVLKESNKSTGRFDSYSHQEYCIDHIPYYLSGLSRAHFFQQPFLK